MSAIMLTKMVATVTLALRFVMDTCIAMGDTATNRNNFVLPIEDAAVAVARFEPVTSHFAPVANR